jgi:hypothetical protein
MPKKWMSEKTPDFQKKDTEKRLSDSLFSIPTYIRTGLFN